MRRFGIILTLALIVVGPPLAWAFTCPVVINQAEDLIKKAESGKVDVAHGSPIWLIGAGFVA